MERDKVFKAELEKHQLNSTKSRLLIFRALSKNKPLRASVIADKLTGKVDRATVYRTLDTFERIGVVQRTWLGFKSQYELAELFLPHHHHLTCIRCHRVEVIDDEHIEKQLKKLAKQEGFRIKDHLLEVSGICAKCQR